MGTYAGVTITEVMPDPTRRPDWRRQALISRRPIPYANREDVQSIGLGNWTITVPVTMTGSGDLATLQAAQGTTVRTLSLFGSSYSAILTNVGDPYRYENETRFVVDLTFEREGT